MTIFGGHVLYDRRQKMALEENVILKFVATTGQHHYVREPPSYLECSICEQLLQDPVVCESGSHLFCRRCLVQWMKQSPTPSCPIDREAFKTGPEGLKRAPRALQDCIDALEVICALGCGWTGGQASWANHLRRECPEVKNDDTPGRKARSGSIPPALHGALSRKRTASALEQEPPPPAKREAVKSIPTGNNSKKPRSRRVGATCEICESVVCPFVLCEDCWNEGHRDIDAAAHGYVMIRDMKDWFPGKESPKKTRI